MLINIEDKMGTTTELHPVKFETIGSVKNICQKCPSCATNVMNGNALIPKKLPFELSYRVGDVLGKGGFWCCLRWLA